MKVKDRRTHLPVTQGAPCTFCRPLYVTRLGALNPARSEGRTQRDELVDDIWSEVRLTEPMAFRPKRRGTLLYPTTHPTAPPPQNGTMDPVRVWGPEFV